MVAMKYLKTFLRWIFIVLTFGFLIYVLYTSLKELQGYTFNISWNLFLFSYIFLFLHFVLVALAWGLLVRALKKPGVPLLDALRIRTISDFARFLPGKMWYILARVQMCKKYAISSEIIAFSALMETYLNILSTLLVYIVVFFLVAHDPLSTYVFYLFLFLPVPFIFLHPKAFQPFANIIAKIFKRQYTIFTVRYSYLVSLLSIFFVAWIILGVGFFLMTASVYSVDVSLILPLIGVFAIAWAAGFIIFILPAGLGLREAVLSYLLSFFVPLPIAIIVALLSRFWLISGEALTALIFRLVK